MRAFSAARFEPTLYPKHLPTKSGFRLLKNSVHGTNPRHHPTSSKRQVQRLPRFQEFRGSVYSEAEKHYLQDLMSLAE